LSFLIFTFLVFPFLALFSRANSVRLPLNNEILNVFVSTALQALVSASVALGCGVLGGLGLLWGLRRTRYFSWLEGLVLLPNAAPVLLLLLAVVKIFPWARGVGGIVFVHALLNIGLVSVAFRQLVLQKISGMAELAYVEGASAWRFFCRGALPVLRADLLLLFIFVFAVCFASFAVPLMLGGSRATTVEVLIYQKIRINGEWSEAVGLAFMQMLALLLLAWLLRWRSESASGTFRRVATPLLQWSPGLLIAVFPAVVLITGLFSDIGSGIEQLKALPELLEEIPALFSGSLLIGVMAGFWVMILLLALSYVRPEGWLARFLSGYAAPSSVLIGFAILLAWPASGLATYFKIAIGLALVTLPAFYRYQWHATLASLHGQVNIARTLGADDFLIFRRVIFPQVVVAASRIGGLAALWAWGDFALSSVIAERSVSLALTVQGLMGAYRLDAATVLIWILITGGLLTYSVFFMLGQGVGNVLGAKSET
jgi:thiamine transport system permease protein